MSTMQRAQAYFDAWNGHDCAAIAGLFTAGGSYSDPNVPDGIAGEQLSAYAAAIFAAFSDLKFETVNRIENGNGAMIAEWQMTGTHDGELQQVVGFAVHVGAAVQQDGGAPGVGQVGGDGRAVDARQCIQGHLAGDHESARMACAQGRQCSSSIMS